MKLEDKIYQIIMPYLNNIQDNDKLEYLSNTSAEYVSLKIWQILKEEEIEKRGLKPLKTSEA